MSEYIESSVIAASSYSKRDQSSPRLRATKEDLSEGVMEITYNPELCITRSQLLAVSRVRSLALKNLISPSDPTLRCSLTKIYLLRFMTARICVEHNPKVHFSSVLQILLLIKTYCCSSAFACSSGPPRTLGTRVSAAQFKICCPSMEHCLRAAQPSV